MRLIFIFFIFVNFINIFDALVCPIYLPRYQKQSLIKSCQSNCSFKTRFEPPSACIGLYSNHSGEVLIKQLEMFSGDAQCLTSKDCILEIDSENSQSYYCCCSTDNCTLNWKIVPRITTTMTTTYRSILFTNTTINIEQNQFSWKLLLIIFLLIMISILIGFTIGLWRSLRHQKENQDDKTFLKPSLWIEQLFFSAEQINIGKNSIVYKTSMENDIVALKVYKQTNMLIWKNEMTLLKSIKHESIIPILSEGEYHSDFYLIFPYHENGTLQSYLCAPNRTLSIEQCLTYFRSLASAISYLHLRQTTIVHRDIKSSNILIGRNPLNIYLADFGVALALPQILTEKDFVQIGTLRYMAPELLEGVIAHTREALCSVDMYALALVLWEILAQCDVYPVTVYRPPYDEHVGNISDGSYFAGQLYDIIVIRKCRPILNRELKDKQYAPIINELCSLIDACWTTDSDMRMNSQTLAFKLNQLM